MGAGLRPRFEARVGGRPDEVLARVRARLEGARRGYVVRVLGAHLDVCVADRERRVFSPCVHVECVAEPETAHSDGANAGSRATTRVHGLVGPMPHVWTMYACAAMVAGLGALFAAMLGWSQVLVDESPWGLWAASGLAGVVAVLWIGAQVGQRLASAQTDELRSEVLAALEAD